MPPLPTPNPQELTPTNLQHSYSKGTPCCPTTYCQPTGSTTHQLTTLALVDLHPLPPANGEYHLPTYNTHALKGPPPAPYPSQQGLSPTNLHTHTLKRPPPPHPYPPVHKEHHLPTYNTHTVKGSPAPTLYRQPTGSTTHQLTTLMLTVLTQTILIRYEFNSVTTFVLKEKKPFLIKSYEYYDCVFKIMLSTKITLSEFIENMCYFYFQM